MSGISSKTILDLQTSLNKAVKWAKELEESNAKFEARVKALEGKFSTLWGRLTWRKA